MMKESSPETVNIRSGLKSFEKYISQYSIYTIRWESVDELRWQRRTFVSTYYGFDYPHRHKLFWNTLFCPLPGRGAGNKKLGS